MNTMRELLGIAATFTAEPLEESLRFWCDTLQLPFEVRFAPYNQVFQQLLDPQSLLATNHTGVNVVLVRLEDWLRDRKSIRSDPGDGAAIERNTSDLISAVDSGRERNRAPHVVFLDATPSEPTRYERWREFVVPAESRLRSAMKESSGFLFFTAADLSAQYPVASWYDAEGDQSGHVPYTPEFFAALGTFIARRLDGLRRLPRKVIALDCDNTIWRGVCGEDGPQGVKLDAPLRALQECMREQRAGGRLLCLCSKNSEADVAAVFSGRTDLPLCWDDFAARRINWQPKSQNLVELAAELNLGLDSFIFIDDNPAECAEVRAHCPEVLVLQLPDRSERIGSFLRHVWPLDQGKLTTEDRRRSEMYGQMRQRAAFESATQSFADFISGLQLVIDIHAVTPGELPRIAQLTERTNQFNFTTFRRTEAEIRTLLAAGYATLAVQVRDRFGDYGLVGAVIFRVVDSILEVDTMLLSCRVLGRGVEHRVLAALGEIAQSQGLSHIRLAYAPTKKNAPARDFAVSVSGIFQTPTGEGLSFLLPADYAAAIKFNPGAHRAPVAKAAADAGTENGDNAKQLRSLSPVTYARIAEQLTEPARILEQVRGGRCAPRPTLKNAFVVPRNAAEQTLARIWQEVLGVDRVGIHDDFFELGGDSILSVQIISKAARAGLRFTLRQQFQFPTIATLVPAIGAANVLVEPAVQTAVTGSGGTAPADFPLAKLSQKGLERVLARLAKSQA